MSDASDPVSPPAPRRRFSVVLNRESGTLRDLWHEGLPDELRDAFAAAGADAMIDPAAPPDLDDAMAKAIAAKPDAIIVGGGDGTVSNAARKLAGTGIPLGILPFGTFNLAARDLKVPLDGLEAAAALARAPVSEIDMLDVAGVVCLCTTLIGSYPALAAREEEYHGQAWWRKSIRVAKQTFVGWRRVPPLDVAIETAEHGTLHRRTRFTAFVPGEYDDIFSVIPQRHHLDSGTMTIYLSKHRGLPGIFCGALAYLFGRLDSSADIDKVSTTGVTLRARRRRWLTAMIDGEVTRLDLPLELRLRPRALMVLHPGKEER